MVRGTISGKDQLLGIHALVIFWKICQVRNSNTYALNTFGKCLKKDFRMTAHSLRHTFRDRLRASGCPLELIDQIGGWPSIGTIGSKYGQGYGLNAVREQIQSTSINFLLTQ
jgi:integrase